MADPSMSSALRVRKAPAWKAPGFHRGLYDSVSRGCTKGLAGPDTDQHALAFSHGNGVFLTPVRPGSTM